MDKEILEKLQQIEKRYRNLKYLLAGFITITVITLISFRYIHVKKSDIIRVKGIIVEDENGKDRILIGSPVPHSKYRVRTDSSLVRKYWASQFKNPDEYMEWYKGYKNSLNGIVFMNEEGFDEVLVGENLSDANVGKRMFECNGIIWNNKKGWERGGAGVNTTDDGKSRPTIGLDDDSGEALHMICLEDGSKALIISDEDGSIRIGMSKKPGELFQNKESFTGIKYASNDGKLVWEQHMNDTKKR